MLVFSYICLMIHGATYFTVCWKFITRLSTLTALGCKIPDDGFVVKTMTCPMFFATMIFNEFFRTLISLADVADD